MIEKSSYRVFRCGQKASSTATVNKDIPKRNMSNNAQAQNTPTRHPYVLFRLQS